MSSELKKVEIFADGACSGNPGPGGWGTILRCNGKEKELSGGSPHINILITVELLEYQIKKEYELQIKREPYWIV